MSVLSRSREFAALRDSRSSLRPISSSRSQQALTPARHLKHPSESSSLATSSEYICLNCENNQLSNLKQSAIRQQRTA